MKFLVVESIDKFEKFQCVPKKVLAKGTPVNISTFGLFILRFYSCFQLFGFYNFDILEISLVR